MVPKFRASVNVDSSSTGLHALVHAPSLAPPLPLTAASAAADPSSRSRIEQGFLHDVMIMVWLSP